MFLTKLYTSGFRGRWPATKNHRLAKNPREPSDWQAVEGKKPQARHARGQMWGQLGGQLVATPTIGSPRWEDSWGHSWEHSCGHRARTTDLLG